MVKIMARTVLDGAWEVVDEWVTTQEPRTEIFSLSFDVRGDDYRYSFQEGWAVINTDERLLIGDEIVGRNTLYDVMKKASCAHYSWDSLAIAYVEFVRESNAGHPVFKVVELNPPKDILNKAIYAFENDKMYPNHLLPKVEDLGVMLWEDRRIELTIGDLMANNCKTCRFLKYSYHCIDCSEFDGEIEDCASFCTYCNSNYGDERCNNCVWYSE